MGLEHFSAALDLLKGFHINLYVGDQVIKGKLMGVEADHIILEDENKFIYYFNIDKVQAITKNTRQFQSEDIKGNFQKTKSLTELLETFRNSWVSILSLNKQKFSGVLSDIDADFATLINGDERILIKLTHVSNILKGFIPEAPKNEENQSKNENEKSEEKAQAKVEVKSPPKLEKKPKPIPLKEVNKPEAEEQKEEKVPCLTIEETSNTMGWSESIKEIPVKPLLGEMNTETPKMKEAKEVREVKEVKEVKAVNEVKEVKEVKNVAAAPKMSTEVSKTTNTKPQQEKKKEEVAQVKTKPLAPLKPAKEETKSEKVEKNTTAPMTIKEAKPTKKQEPHTAEKQETTRDQSTKTNTSDQSKTVWRPSQQDDRIFRFAGEPAPKNLEKNFPFAGWPNRNNNRSSRNLFF